MGDLNKKILLLSTGDVNGAYEAIYKLGYFFMDQGHTVNMLVKHKTKNEEFIVRYYENKKQISKRSLLMRVLMKIRNKLKNEVKEKQNLVHFENKYSFISRDETKENISPENVVSQIGFIPEIIISGMTNDFINSTDLLNLYKYTGAKIFNITVDMNHFTGGCHYAWDCNGYIKGCDERCPAIIGENARDLAKINFEAKFKNAKEGNFQIISGSGWTLKQAKDSKIYKDQKVFYNINSLIDTEIFNAKNKDIAKRIFGFDDSKFYILAGSQNSHDPRKGFSYFIEALKILETQLSIEQKNKIVILVVSREVVEEFKTLKFEKQKIDYITDYRLLILLYQAVDLFVNSSVEDSGPMMVSEAMACGTPVVGFDMGVVNNMVINDFNGYKAVLKDSKDLSLGIKKILDLTDLEYNSYSKNAVNQIKEYSSFEFAAKIFDEIINA